MFRRPLLVERLRPGPLANFSAGAAYMPLIAMFFVWPLTFLANLAATTVLYSRARALRRGESPGEVVGPRADASEFLRYVRLHFYVCSVGGAAWAVLGTLFAHGGTYGGSHYGAAAILVGGPVLAWLGSNYLLVRWVLRGGAHWTQLVAAFGCFLLGSLGCAILGAALSG